MLARPGYTTKYLASLQARHGNVHFAGGDIASIWRGFIDGAAESGKVSAAAVIKALKEE